MNELALFAGAGGGLLASHLLGWRTVCAIELDPYCRSVLLARQRDGHLGRFPIWDDVTTFDGAPWLGSVDVVSGGFPCQDISAAGRGAGIGGQRSGLWAHMARIVGEVRPRYVLVENSPMLVSRGLDVVLADLATLGFDARWGVIGAIHAGAPHRRERLWILATHAVRHGCGFGTIQHEQLAGRSATANVSTNGAARDVAHTSEQYRPEHGQATPEPGRGREAVANANGERQLQPQGVERVKRGRTGDGGDEIPDAVLQGLEGPRGEHQLREPADEAEVGGEGWWTTEPNVGRVADELAPDLDIHGAAAVGHVDRVEKGVPDRVLRLKAIGNGQVPQCAAMAWRTLGGPIA